MATVDIEDDKFEVLKVRASEKGYDNTDEYVDYLLSQVVEKIKKEKKDEKYSDEEEEEVKEKLKDLGYM